MGAATLAEVPLGSHVVLLASRHEPMRTLRLAEVGLRIGSRLVVMSRTAGGGRVVAVGHARIALDREVASRLRVATVEP